MGGKQSIADVKFVHLTEGEIKHTTGIFQQICRIAPDKGCTYDEFLHFCEKIHPLLTQFLIEYYFGYEHDTSAVIETPKEFLSLYTCLVRGSNEDKTKLMEVLLFKLKSESKKTKNITPASILQRKLTSLDINFDIDEHTFRLRQENYLRGLICTYIKLEYAADNEEFNSWRRVKSRFSIGDIDKLTKSLQGHKPVPSSSDDMAKWIRTWKTTSMLHYVVYGHLFCMDDFQVIRSLYPLCESKHKQNICLMDMCSIIHLNCRLPQKFRNCWRLLFSSAIHGANFPHMMERIVLEGPNIVVIRDKNNHIFGGYAAETWRPAVGFYGNYTSFLFQIHPNIAIYEASGTDENYQFMKVKGHHRGFGMGRGPLNLYGWWIEPDRLRGSCALSCSTFQDLPVLAGTQYFQIHTFEIWGVDDSPRRQKRRANIRFHTFASQKVIADSNIRTAGKVLLKRTGVRRYTDGYGIAKAAEKWQEAEDDAPHAVEKEAAAAADDDDDDDEEEDEFDDEDESTDESDV